MIGRYDHAFACAWGVFLGAWELGHRSVVASMANALVFLVVICTVWWVWNNVEVRVK